MDGLRASTELWTAVEPVDGTTDCDVVGDAVLAAIAEAQLEEGTSQVPSGLERLVRKSERTLLRRQESELTRRLSENDALIEAHVISLRETHDRKVGQINARIQTLEAAAGNTAITRLPHGPARQPRPAVAESDDGS